MENTEPADDEPSDFRTLGKDTPEAIHFGRLVHPVDGVSNPLRYSGQKHFLVFGPNGSGKGIRLLIPNLLQMHGRRSVVVIDPKGELAAVTAPFRRQVGRVIILNPFGILTDWPGYEDLRSHGFNPLARLDPDSPLFDSRCSRLAEALVSIDSKQEPIWEESARALVAALIMYTVIEARQLGQPPSLVRVRDLICLASDGAHATNNYMPKGIPALALQMSDTALRGMRNKFSQFDNWNKTVQSIVSVAKTHTAFLDNPLMAEDLLYDGCNFDYLKTEPVTVYVILPPDELEKQSKWLRLVITSALDACMRPRRKGECRVLFMIDEFFALGKLEIISTVWALVRGYGIQIMPVLQDLGQLKKLYPDMWETFIGMSGVTTSFAANDLTTAKWLSERCGETTRMSNNLNKTVSTSGGTNRGSGPGGATSGSNDGWSISTSTSQTPVKVSALTPHDLMNLQTGYMVAIIGGMSHVVPAFASAYLRLTDCLPRKRDNPYHQPD